MQDPRSVERLRKGDVATLKRLFKANYSQLYPLAYRLTGDGDAAGTVIRRAFQVLWADRENLDVFDPLDLILLRATYLEAQEYRTANGIGATTVFADTISDSEDVPIDLGMIPDEHRLQYLLFVVDGYSVRELARVFDVSAEELQLSIGKALLALAPIDDYSAS